MAVHVFVRQLAFHQHLRSDPGVIGAHLPQSTLALHALIADQGVHERLVKGMSHVQGAGDIGRRYEDAVTVTVAAGFEEIRLVPVLVEALFNGLRIKIVVHSDSNNAW